MNAFPTSGISLPLPHFGDFSVGWIFDKVEQAAGGISFTMPAFSEASSAAATFLAAIVDAVVSLAADVASLTTIVTKAAFGGLTLAAVIEDLQGVFDSMMSTIQNDIVNPFFALMTDAVTVIDPPGEPPSGNKPVANGSEVTRSR